MKKQWESHGRVFLFLPQGQGMLHPQENTASSYAIALIYHGAFKEDTAPALICKTLKKKPPHTHQTNIKFALAWMGKKDGI